MAELEILSVVALLEDIPQKGLRRGQVGTVVEALASGVYEVDFSDDSGRSYVSAAISGNLVLRLLHEATSQAA